MPDRPIHTHSMALCLPYQSINNTYWHRRISYLSVPLISSNMDNNQCAKTLKATSFLNNQKIQTNFLIYNCIPTTLRLLLSFDPIRHTLFIFCSFNPAVSFKWLTQLQCWSLYWRTWAVIIFHPGARFTKDFLPAIQIRWKPCLAVILLLAIRSQQVFAHATTAQLSYHVQNFAAITVLETSWEQIENFHRIWIVMEKLFVKRDPRA